MIALAVENLSLSFGGMRALNGLSFDVAEGETFAIIGPNGAGKSTIFNAISRIYDPDSGSIRYRGEELLRHQPYEMAGLGVARTFQNIELFENATVLENLLVGRTSRIPSNWVAEWFFTKGVRSEEHRHRLKIEQILELLDMQQYRYERVRDLSYGVRKNVELARALCAEPKLLLLDEPASGLNPEETTDMSFWLKDIKEELNVTIVLVEHDMNLVGRVADTCMAIASGEVLAIGTIEQVRSNIDVQNAYLGTQD